MRKTRRKTRNLAWVYRLSFGYKFSLQVEIEVGCNDNAMTDNYDFGLWVLQYN